jgi:hypothetical protein
MSYIFYWVFEKGQFSPAPKDHPMSDWGMGEFGDAVLGRHGYERIHTYGNEVMRTVQLYLRDAEIFPFLIELMLSDQGLMSVYVKHPPDVLALLNMALPMVQSDLLSWLNEMLDPVYEIAKRHPSYREHLREMRELRQKYKKDA